MLPARQLLHVTECLGTMRWPKYLSPFGRLPMDYLYSRYRA